MTPSSPSYRAVRATPRPLRARLHVRGLLAAAASVLALATCATSVLAFPPTHAPAARASAAEAAEALETYVAENAQTLAVPVTAAVVAPPARASFAVESGITTLAAGGTNHDWAKLVLLYAGFPRSEQNVAVFTRWMRQENGTDDWWNRNNPLNNGWGSGGGSGLGSYANLDLAAQNAAEALHSNRGYSAIVAAFASSAPTAVTEQAIWASPWASSHYANGAHWSQAPVPVVKSPAGTW
jgi:hypothetical protein